MRPLIGVDRALTHLRKSRGAGKIFLESLKARASDNSDLHRKIFFLRKHSDRTNTTRQIVNTLDEKLGPPARTRADLGAECLMGTTL
jgi:hypothetical protein